jgi:serine/threonine-protein kinase ULK/ATG1
MQKVGIYSYDPAKQIGRGSFADVFRGIGPESSTVAIKRIHRSRLAKETSKKLLKSEIKTMQEAQHKNVVKFLDCVDTEAHVCIVMEFCNGGNLGSYVAEKAPLSEGKIVHLLHGIASALQCLHAKRILHRDLKPENILIKYEKGSDEPIVKIADFGFARHLNQSMAETFCGSPLYMAPEVRCCTVVVCRVSGLSWMLNRIPCLQSA